MRVFIYEGTVEEILKLFGDTTTPSMVSRNPGIRIEGRGGDFLERFAEKLSVDKDKKNTQVSRSTKKETSSRVSGKKPGASRPPRTRISEEVRKDVIELAEVDTSITEIAQLTGISLSSVGRIIKSAVDGCGSPLKYNFKGKRKAITQEQIAKIKHLYSEGLNRRVIADRVGVSLSTVSRAINYR